MKRKDIKNKLKEYFFLYPTIKLRVRQMERELKVPLPSVIRYTKELEQEGIVKKEVIAGVTLFSSQRASQQYLLEKIIHNFRSLYTSGLVEYLQEHLDRPAIILFGSYSRGEDTEKSDIDLYIQTPITRTPPVDKFEKELNRNIQIFQHKKFKEIENKFLRNNIINGLPICGKVEVFT